MWGGRGSESARRNEMYYVGRGEEKEEEGKSPGERRERGEGEEKEVKKPQRKKKAGRRRRKRSEKAPEEEESGAKKKEKQEKSPGGRRKRGEGEEKAGKKSQRRVQICAGKCIRAGINCLLMNMCREFDLIFQM